MKTTVLFLSMFAHAWPKFSVHAEVQYKNMDTEREPTEIVPSFSKCSISLSADTLKVLTLTVH